MTSTRIAGVIAHGYISNHGYMTWIYHDHISPCRIHVRNHVVILVNVRVENHVCLVVGVVITPAPPDFFADYSADDSSNPVGDLPDSG